ncbi:hypothetical protein SAMN04488077_10915 [Roseovarius tolerans]|jgi:Zn-finger nucleic acid-binding protein|uniref:Transcription factor zinc-finger domain-containing protein n=1 Tax=Roseovarius tolerans TaxID=74031 RepID=A0A1H8BXM5_9RHOB|nr:zf-TFIIB domain-containing protein [Roseovarius tolerans]SEM87482.1 hypothetical protein SAMN04488077_10915 [Roseovarius tolerans]
MQCPIDGTALVIAERAGVEIDYCPQCRGVWLDRGELDKIIDRSASEAVAPPRSDDRGYSGGKPRKKRGGFLEDLFDF